VLQWVRTEVTLAQIVEGALGGDFAAASIDRSGTGESTTKMEASREVIVREIQTTKDLLCLRCNL
jgi:hypothetical protein